MGLLRTAPLFALAFEGALLPLSMHEPALSPLLALPNTIAPRTEPRRIYLLFTGKSDAKLLNFHITSKSKSDYLYIFRLILNCEKASRRSAMRAT